MVKGRPKGSNTNSLLRASQLSVWAQCDNQNCQKWRRLPPGSVVDDTVPWFVHITQSFHRQASDNEHGHCTSARKKQCCMLGPFLLHGLEGPDLSPFPVGSVT